MKKEILLIECDFQNMKEIINSLPREYHLHLAGEGKEALEEVRKNPPDLILLNAQLKGMSSREVCHSIRQQFDKETLPIVILNERNQKDLIIHQTYEDGANEYIPFPFIPKEFLTRIEDQLLLKEMRQGQKKKTKDRNLFLTLLKQEFFTLSLDHEKKIETCSFNEEEFLGYTAAEITGGKIEVLFPQMGEGFSDIPQALEEKNPLLIETLVKPKIGTPFLMNLHLGKLHTEEKVFFFFRSPKKTCAREFLVNMMKLSLQYWKLTAGKSKVDLAEESNYWCVTKNDYGPGQVKTMDRHLDLTKLPQKPQWDNVFKTATYVLSNSHIDPHKQIPDHLKIELEKNINLYWEIVEK